MSTDKNFTAHCAPFGECKPGSFKEPGHFFGKIQTGIPLSSAMRNLKS